MMVFITRCLKRLEPVVAGALLALGLMLTSASCRADEIPVLRAEARVDDGRLELATRFRLQLPATLQDAVQQGVPLTFRLEFELTRPRLYSLYYNWFGSSASLSYKLSYYRLTNSYRVSMGSLSNSYNSLNEALASVGLISGWRVLDVSDWTRSDQERIGGRVRLLLDTSELPRPFQLGALGSSDWSLSSGWTTLNLRSGG